MKRSLLLTLILSLCAAGSSQAQSGATVRKKVSGPDPFDAVFINSNQVRMILQVEKVEIETTYGKLAVPMRDVYAIEFGVRFPPGMAEKIDLAIRDLASRDEAESMRAGQALVQFGPYSYQAVLRLSKANDREMQRRAQEVLRRLGQRFSNKELARSSEDVVVTPKMRIAGKISDAAWLANVEYFGANNIELAKLVSLSNTNVVKEPTDQDRIQGTWIVTQFDQGGFMVMEEMSFTFAKDHVVVHGFGFGFGRRNGPGGSYKLGAIESLKTIDIVMEDEPMLGIYLIEGTTMKMCLSRSRRGQARPTDFASAPGSEQIMLVLEKRSQE